MRQRYESCLILGGGNSRAWDSKEIGGKMQFATNLDRDLRDLNQHSAQVLS